MDSYEGDQAEPQTLNKYTYTSDDPVNHVDPTGLTETLTETGVGNAIRADLAATILFNVGLAYTAIKADAWVDWIHDRNDVYAFTRSHHDSTITQLDFDQLEGRINRGLRRRHLYLHYSFRDAATDLLAEGLFNYKPSWVTRTAYPTGWTAHSTLALPSYEIQDAVYIVMPRPGFNPVGPSDIPSPPPKPKDKDEANRPLAGGGQEWRFSNGSGGPGTVFGPIRLQVGPHPPP
jgi:hypothetical protein